MTQSVVNRLQANVTGLRPDLFPIFAETVAKIDEADAAGCDVTRDIGYATADAILGAAVDIVPRDVENILHRIGCANRLLDRLHELCCYEEGGVELIDKMSKLLNGAAKGLADAYEIDMHATRLDFYLPQPYEQN